MESKQDPGEAGGRDAAAQEETVREPEAKDALCGLLNREAVVRHVEKRLAAMADADSCALFLIDLDDFSRVNATFGRLAGDRAIRQVARILSGLFRASDVLGRLWPAASYGKIGVDGLTPLIMPLSDIEGVYLLVKRKVAKFC